MSKAVLDKIKEGKVIAIVRGIPSKDIVKLANAMYAGGLNCIEVTFDQSNPADFSATLDSIRAIKENLGDKIFVGAGTVMSVEQVHMAVEAGAEYIISPNVDEAVIKETKKLDKVSIPGAMTATEAALAYSYGADIVKMFPAGVLGAAYIKAIKSPLKHIPMTAVGSVNPQNCAEFFKAGCCGVGVGGNLVSKKLVDEGRFDEITAVAKEYVDALKDF
ncbi:MAG: bifunctional 4-hydroxy-2-oxoglutarate aldolase/2-dehydro-3-deoxy-phosphogluconate aldolase [Oscillospiraceae bacterium]|nr:bifunctional 4-hydroxy-2-oxoglutarate aldolase/2-dehydro-3-deoxy-phosphogluconate aldolase [Oscillospiraceae bacterium]